MDKQIKQKYSTNTIRLHRSMPIFLFEMNLLLLAGDQINSFFRNCGNKIQGQQVSHDRLS